MTVWTRHAAHETRHDLIDVMRELAEDQSLLARSVEPTRRRMFRLRPLPERGPRYWTIQRNGSAPEYPPPGHPARFPAAAWCGQCQTPSALGSRYACPTHARPAAEGQL